MPRVGPLLLALATATGGAAAAVPRAPTTPAAGAVVDLLPADDPFPIRRVRGTDARLPDLLKELEPGPIARLPRAAFESRVRAAGRATAAAKSGAKLTDVQYAATFDGTDLTGTAELGVLNAHGTTGFVPLDPLRVAVRGAKWADGRAAVLAMQNGVPAVWVDRPGRGVLRLEWSLAGTTEPGERRFELRTPPCPVAVLEVDLPAGQVPAAASDGLLTGPFDAPGRPGRKVWRLRFGGRAKAEFAVRPASQPAGATQARLLAKYDVQPGQLTASFEYDLRPARGSAGEWWFTADPALRVADVATNNRAGWSVDPPTVPGGPRRVRVTLRQPAPGGKVLITAVAPVPAADAPLPAVRPVDAVLDDERVEVRLAPGLKVESWGAGDYRLTDAATAADATRTLTLVGTLLPPGADEPFRRMPSVRAVGYDAEFTTSERLEWHLGPDRSVLEARVAVRVRRGPQFQLAVRPPPGYALDRGEAGADELLSHVGPAAGGQQVLEFARPLATGQTAELRLEYRAPAKPGEERPFPPFAVVGAAERDGWLSVSAAPGWDVVTRPGVAAVSGGLWGWLIADYPADARALYLYRGRPPDGAAALAPVTSTPGVTVVRIEAAGGGRVAVARLPVGPTAAAGVVVIVPGPPDERTWRLSDSTNAVVGTWAVPRELAGVAALLSPVDRRAAVAAAGADAGATVWAVRFARPLSGAAVLETAAPVTTATPIPRVPGLAPTVRVEVAPGSGDTLAAVQDGDYVRVRSAGAPAAAGVTDAYLVTVVRGPGDAVAAFGGTAGGRGGVRLDLPAGAEVRGVCVGGRWLAPAACADRDAGGALRIPIPTTGGARFEVRYRLPVAPGWPTRRVDSPVPRVEGGTPPVGRWWAFSDGMLPGLPALAWGRAAAAPPLLGGPLGDESPGVVLRASDGEWVRAGEARTADAVAAALAAVLVACGAVAARRRRAREAFALGVALVVALIAVEVGPPWWARAAWPPLCAATAALAAVLVAVAADRRAPVAALATTLLFLIPALTATGQPAGPATVALVSTDRGEEVVAPRSLLDRLDALARPSAPAPVVTGATYDVRADDAGARVAARFVVHSFRPGENVLTLPLSDVRLERATVDGGGAYPSVTAGGYAVAVGGPGRHEVELRFAATVAAAGPERDLRFGIPEVPDTRLTATLPGEARQPSAVGRVGGQATTPGGERTAVAADLGAVRAVHLRWREGAGGAASVTVREACVWDVAEQGADLTAAYLVRVEKGAVAGLRYEVPAELDVLRVLVRTLDAPAGAVPLRDWSLAPDKGAQRLRIDFQAPASGRLLAVLECAPRKPLNRQPVLRFPRALFGTGAGEADAVYGLRASRVQVDGVGLGGVIDFPADVLKDFADVPDLRLGGPGAVRAFRPVTGASPELRPVLRVGDEPAVRTSTLWHAGPGRADGSGVVTWQAKEFQPLVEFALPGVKVLEVRGADVAGWNQSGGRVQVWLRPGGRDGSFEWLGSATPADGAFEPAHPAVARGRHQADEVRVRAVPGWAAKPDRTRGWQAAPAAAGELRFTTDLPAAPPLRVQLVQSK